MSVCWYPLSIEVPDVVSVGTCDHHRRIGSSSALGSSHRQSFERAARPESRWHGPSLARLTPGQPTRHHKWSVCVGTCVNHPVLPSARIPLQTVWASHQTVDIKKCPVRLWARPVNSSGHVLASTQRPCCIIEWAAVQTVYMPFCQLAGMVGLSEDCPSD